jgi:hypothetical protein
VEGLIRTPRRSAWAYEERVIEYIFINRKEKKYALYEEGGGRYKVIMPSHEGRAYILTLGCITLPKYLHLQNYSCY